MTLPVALWSEEVVPVYLPHLFWGGGTDCLDPHPIPSSLGPFLPMVCNAALSQVLIHGTALH